jgi:hypothetical protein
MQGLGDRFTFYAQRVCEFVMAKCDQYREEEGPTFNLGESYAESALIAGRIQYRLDRLVFVLWSRMQHLFPRASGLKVTLGFTCMIPDVVNLDIMIWPAKLKHFDLSTEGHGPASFGLGLARNLLGAAGHMESFAVRDIGSPLGEIEEWTALAGRFISHTSQLREWTTAWPLPLPDMIRLCSRCSLQILRIGKITELLPAPTAVVLPDSALASLHTLRLEDDSVDARVAHALLNSVGNHLRTVHVYLDFPHTIVSDVFTSIAEHLANHQQLVEIKLNGYGFASTKAPNTINEHQSLALSTRIFAAFGRLSELEVLDIRTKLNMSINITIVRQLLAACPRLRYWKVTLVSCEGFNGQTRGLTCTVPFADFLALLRTHSKVEQLPLWVDITDYALVSPELAPMGGQLTYGPHLLLACTNSTIFDAFAKVATGFLPRVGKLLCPDLNWWADSSSLTDWDTQ